MSERNDELRTKCLNDDVKACLELVDSCMRGMAANIPEPLECARAAAEHLCELGPEKICAATGNASGDCPLGLGRICYTFAEAYAGGVIGDGATRKRKVEELSARACACGEKRACERPAATNEQREEAFLAGLAVLSDEELRNNRCNADRYADLQARLREAKEIPNVVSGTGKSLHLVFHSTLPVGRAGTEIKLTANLGGEVHVFALGFAPTRIEVLDGAGYASRIRSVYPWPEAPNDEVLGGLVNIARRGPDRLRLHDSKVVQANAGDEIVVRVKGGGCTLVAAYDEF